MKYILDMDITDSSVHVAACGEPTTDNSWRFKYRPPSILLSPEHIQGIATTW